MADELNELSQRLVIELSGRGLKITTAESCTGGLIASTITDTSGASAVFDLGFVTYANDAKKSALGVDALTLTSHGAVSEQVAYEMAEGARKKTGADIAISATGIAGPSGGSQEKPVGLVFIGHSSKECTEVRRFNFKGDRHEIRKQAVKAALEMALGCLKIL